MSSYVFLPLILASAIQVNGSIDIKKVGPPPGMPEVFKTPENQIKFGVEIIRQRRAIEAKKCKMLVVLVVGGEFKEGEQTKEIALQTWQKSHPDSFYRILENVPVGTNVFGNELKEGRYWIYWYWNGTAIWKQHEPNLRMFYYEPNWK